MRTVRQVIGNDGIAEQIRYGMLSCFDDETLYEILYNYYAFERGDMPYGIMKGRDGDPIHWIDNRVADELEFGYLEEQQGIWGC